MLSVVIALLGIASGWLIFKKRPLHPAAAVTREQILRRRDLRCGDHQPD